MKVISEQVYRERECIHRASGTTGKFYNGRAYINHLQHLKGDRALNFATRVTPFFWSDANEILVWLCQDCALELGLANKP